MYLYTLTRGAFTRLFPKKSRRWMVISVGTPNCCLSIGRIYREYLLAELGGNRRQIVGRFDSTYRTLGHGDVVQDEQGRWCGGNYFESVEKLPRSKTKLALA